MSDGNFVCQRNVVSSIILMIISGAKAMAHYYYLYKKPESSGMVSVRVGIWASFFGNKRVDQFINLLQKRMDIWATNTLV